MVRKYKSDLKEEQAKLEKMLCDLEALQVRIAKQKRLIAALAELADAAEDADPPTGLVTGITDAVRTVFWTGDALTPAEVRDRVQALGVPKQENLLASVHTVIRRLVEGKEIEP